MKKGVIAPLVAFIILVVLGSVTILASNVIRDQREFEYVTTPCGELNCPTPTPVANSAVLDVLSTPVTGAGVTGGQSGTSGTTNYTAIIIAGDINTSLYVSSTPSGYSFASWTGCDSVDGIFCIIYVAKGNQRSITANLTGGTTPTPPPSNTNTINVRSSPITGVPIADPRGTKYSTNYTWSGTSNIGGWFVAPTSHNGYTLTDWSGCDAVSGIDWCSTGASGGQTKTITANYTGGSPTPTPTISPTVRPTPKPTPTPRRPWWKWWQR